MTFPAPNPPVPNPPPPQPPSPPPPPPFDLGHEHHTVTVLQAVLLGSIIFLCAISIAFVCARNYPRTIQRVSAADCQPEISMGTPVEAIATMQWPSVAETLSTRQANGRTRSCSGAKDGPRGPLLYT